MILLYSKESPFNDQLCVSNKQELDILELDHVLHD